MAIYNEVQVGRYVRFIQKFFQIKGRQPAPLQYAGELGSVIPLFHGAENRYLEGWQRYSLLTGPAAVAAQFGAIRLRNPSGSNVVAVIEASFCQNVIAVANQIQIDKAVVPNTIVDLATSVQANVTNLDSRGKQLSSSVIASIGTAANVAVGGIIKSAAFDTAVRNWDFIQHVDDEIPLLPGEVIQLRCNTANSAAPSGGFSWRERVLEESELA